jgi:hypothetical protein
MGVLMSFSATDGGVFWQISITETPAAVYRMKNAQAAVTELPPSANHRVIAFAS